MTKDTTQKQLAQAFAAQKGGDLAEAQCCYAAVLQEQSSNPQANHGLGAIAAASGQLNTAISYFKLAVKAQPETEEYWVSLIDTLFEHGDFYAASAAFETGRRNGVIVENLSLLESRFHMPVAGKYPDVSYDATEITMKQAQAKFSEYADDDIRRRALSRVEGLYQKCIPIALNAASPGWLFADSFDRQFTSETALKRDSEVDINLARRGSNSVKGSCRFGQVDPLEALYDLKRINSISQKYQLLGQLVAAERSCVVEGSFCENPSIDLQGAAHTTFTDSALNVLIIGGGPCGLYFASGLKAALRSEVNVLVADNRASEPNLRESFNRKWLTHIRSQLFATPAFDEIFTLLSCFGTDGLLGLPINYLEGILQLFCKTLGVRFFFSPEMNYAAIANQRVDLIFDASGGRLPAGTYTSDASAEYNASIPKAEIAFNESGVSQLFNLPSTVPECVDFALKRKDDLFYPHCAEVSLNYNMLKLTGIPLDVLAQAKKTIDKSNPNNIFFIWSGSLKEEINEGLIFANLTAAESSYLRSAITKPVELGWLLHDSRDAAFSLGDALISMLHFLGKRDLKGGIKIEPVFQYHPAINLGAGSGYFHGNRVYPIGDSLFIGHPKMGNGLSHHFAFIAELHSELQESLAR